MSREPATPPPTRESRSLKIAGMVMMALAAPAFIYLSDQAETKAWLDANAWQLAFMLFVAVAGANLFALGVIVLLAGFTNLPLRTDVRARRGARVKLAGANVLFVCFAFAMIGDTGAFAQWYDDPWIMVPGLILFAYLLRKAIGLLRTGWKYDAVSAHKVLEEDTRQPVVYIRSFKDDDKIIHASGRLRWVSYLTSMYTATTIEQELSIIMNKVGPVVAIGKPGELLPELGAARLYVGDDEWRATITALMRRAKLVVVRAGATANLQWEIDQALALVPRHRLIFLCWGADTDAKAFDRDIERRFGAPGTRENVPLTMPGRLAAMITSPMKDMGKLIYFTGDGKCFVEPIRFTVSWLGYLLMPYRPYRDPLRSALRRVFTQLDLPWAESKSRATAALLALFAGFFGAHQFYLGNRRRGLYYLVFFWALVPFFLAWIDAVRIALMDEQTFRREFGSQRQLPRQ